MRAFPSPVLVCCCCLWASLIDRHPVALLESLLYKQSTLDVAVAVRVFPSSIGVTGGIPTA